MVTLPELALIAGTRVALGAGLGLILGERLDAKQRKAVGLTLLAVGVLTTFPLAAEVVFRHGDDEYGDEDAAEEWTPQRREAVAVAP
jgi:hypothetical protein